MEAISVGTQSRTDFGKGWARKLRRSGMIPAVIYRAGTEATHIAVDPHLLRYAFNQADNPNVLINLEVEGKSYTCLVKDAEKHPVTRALLHVDFYEVDTDTPVTVEVPIATTGKAAGETLGGRVRLERRTIRITAKPGDIPKNVTLDISPMQVDDVLTVAEISLPDGCATDLDDSVNLLACIGKRAAIVETAEAEVEDAEGADEEAGESADENEEG
ncbi:MAG: 50S ribosomal protein L25 [Myxococcota bacterium]|nr:50S ribosomal protein L25 [Myxococcota bacterium]